MRPWLVAASCAVWFSCNCGPQGAPCSTDSECSGMVCLNGHCVGNNGGTGGNGNGQGGNGNGNGGSGNGQGGAGAGTMTLPDGGTCTNLQCQVMQCPPGVDTVVTGTVYDPGGNVPLYNATVYVPNKPLDAFTAGPSCGPCSSGVSGQPVAITLTDAAGKFTLKGVPTGAKVPLVVQIGKWRRTKEIVVAPCVTNTLTDPDLSRLPRNQSEGNIPQMAVSSGDADHFECLLRKIGISDSEFTTPSGSGRVHFYEENGLTMPGAPAGSTLWTNANTLLNYDVVILPCEGGEHKKPDAGVDNVVSYANKGGRVFATHYSYVWTQPGWPAAATWDPGIVPDLYNSTFNVTVDQSFPKGMAFAQWLRNVNASTTLGTLPIRESRHDVTAAQNGSTRWLYGNIPNSSPTASVQHLTFNTPFRDAGFNPDGGARNQCGRVVFSDFHVTAGATDGGPNFPSACVNSPLTGQEKSLEFMLFDLSACVQNDMDAPMVCKAVGTGCASDGECCAGLACRNAQSLPCTGSGCTCQPIIG